MKRGITRPLPIDYIQDEVTGMYTVFDAAGVIKTYTLEEFDRLFDIYDEEKKSSGLSALQELNDAYAKVINEMR